MLECTSPEQTIIPQPVIEYVKENTTKRTGLYKCIYYSTEWENYKIYVVRPFGPYYGTFGPVPYSVFYDENKNIVRFPTKEEHEKTWIYETPKYFIVYASQKYCYDSMD